MIQVASVALSDGLQMADDLIRETLSSQSSLSAPARGIVAPVDSAVVKLAVQRSAKLFGMWLASALEQMAGCEPSADEEDADGILLEVWEKENDEDARQGGKQKERIVVPKVEKEEDNEGSEGNYSQRLASVTSTSFYRMDSFAGESSQGPTKDQKTANLLIKIVVQLDDDVLCNHPRVYSNFLLAICEICRLGSRSMANTLNQSIQTAMDNDAHQRVASDSASLFGDMGVINPHRKGKDTGFLDPEHILSTRFRLAASRTLSMYVQDRGARAAAELCADASCWADASDPYAIPARPREACLRALGIARAACEDCVAIVGGDLFVAPLEPFPEETEYADAFGERLAGAGGGSGNGAGSTAASGVQLDVERMFLEKSSVYTHPSELLEFTRNCVVSGILRVALAALLECVRSSLFSSLGYRQMKVDAIFLRYILPHYVKDEFGTPQANACTCLFNSIDDIMLKVGQRCFEHEEINDDDYYDVEKDEIFTPYQLVQRFLEGEPENMKRIVFS